MKLGAIIFTLALAGAGSVRPAAAQLTGPPQSESQEQTPAPAQAQKPIRVQSSLVDLFATVRDGHHALIGNLGKDDFRVFEDGQQQTITYFSREVELPITLGLMVDTSGSEENRLNAEQEAATRFIHEVLRKKDMAMVLTFDTDVDLLADFTQDLGILDRAIARARINAPPSGSVIAQGPLPQGRVTSTALYDAIYLASHDELADQAGRKALVIVTDAEDEGSKLKLQDAIEAAQRADTVIHILLVSDPGYGANYGVAKKLADETGGRVIEVHNEKSLQKAFDQISEELRSQYVLGYVPSNTAHTGGFRKIAVETAKPGLKVLTRKGYYAPKS